VGKPSLNASQPYAKAEGRVLLLVPAYPGCPETKVVKRLLLLLLLLLLLQGVVNVEVLGTCHAEIEKAAVLRPINLQRYRLHVERGLSFDPPEVL